jgi:DNA-binding MarR family transcriptional regulator
MNENKLPNERERIMAIANACVNTSLRRSTRIVSSFYDEALGTTGLHGNQLVLLVAVYLMGPVGINKLAARVGLDRTTLVRNLKPIEERGLVAIKAGDDLRTRIVTLTPEGREALIQALPLWEAVQEQVVELLGKQHAELVNSLAVLNSLEQKS